MSEAEKDMLLRQEKLLKQLPPVEKQLLLAYGEGLLAGKELAQGKA